MEEPHSLQHMFIPCPLHDLFCRRADRLSVLRRVSVGGSSVVTPILMLIRSHVLNKLELLLLITITAVPTIVFNACEAALWYTLSEKTAANYEYQLAADECYDRGQVPLVHYKEMVSYGQGPNNNGSRVKF